MTPGAFGYPLAPPLTNQLAMLLPSIPTSPSSGAAALDPLAVGLVEWWDFNEQTGSSVGRVNGLTAAPLPSGGVPFRVAGAEGYARNLVRTRAQALVVPDNALLRFPTDLTGFSFTWVQRAKIATFAVNSSILSRANTGANNMEMFVSTQVADRLQARLNTLAALVQVTSPVGEPISLDTYFLYRVWLDNAAQTWNIQVGSGAKVSISTAGKTFTPTNPTTQFGRHSAYWDGGVDLAAYWTRVLTDAEWTRLQSGGDSGRPIVYPFNSLRSLKIVSPCAYQTLQRNAWAAGAGTATFTVEGEYRGAAGASLEVSLAGSEWQEAAGTIGSGRFSVTATFPVCQGSLQVRWSDAPGVVGSTSMVGVGDVVGIDGQSGADGRGFNNQPVTDTTSGFTPTMLGQDGICKVLVDPVNHASTNGVSAWSAINDGAAAGSWIPALVSAWQIDRQCPVMVVSSPLGSTTIAQHFPNAGDHYLPSTLYGCHNARCFLAGPVGFNLVQIGEQNALNHDTSDTMRDGVVTYADAWFTDRGVKSYFSLLQTSTGIPEVDAQAIRDGILAAIALNGNVLLGPNFQPYTTDDSFHLRDDADMTLEGQMWYAAVKADKGA